MRRAIPLFIAPLALTACNQAKPLYVDHAWVRLAAVPGRPAAAYFTVHGGKAPAMLIAVSADTAVLAQMHRSMQSGGVSAMAPIDRLPIPARSTVRFAPGGLHVMLSDVNPVVKPGGTMHLTFSFADGTRIEQDAGVIGAGAPDPK
ncbi:MULTISPECIES: copper chaperone PCu(A)C [unclassified Sphingomonas]|uniref:copper chaperone PCu(A)C n=1 Tax=unclassified Sphingomonas TaxID=196159 RepID=UPI00226A251E|nr:MULTISPECIES: copper chaperone PCu(A)C [unclassified Sphingomonas]